MPLDFLPARQERWNYKGNWLTIPWQCLGDNLENPLVSGIRFRPWGEPSTRDRDCQPNFVTGKENGYVYAPLVHRNWMGTRRRGENIYCKLCDKSRNRFAVYKLSSYLVCEHRYGLCNGGWDGWKGERREGIAKDLREPRSSYVTISVPNIKPINFKHLSRFVWTKPRVCSLFLDVFFFLPFSFYFFFFPIFFFVYRCLSMFMNILGFLLFPPPRYWGIQSVMIYLDSLKSKQQSNKLQNIKIK